jgi:hypothetical protein
MDDDGNINDDVSDNGNVDVVNDDVVPDTNDVNDIDDDGDVAAILPPPPPLPLPLLPLPLMLL